MKPFTFRLAGVLKVWTRKEEQAYAFFQRQMASTAAARDRESEARAARTDAQHRATDALREATAPTEITWYRNWITSLSLRVEAARDEVRRCEQLERAAQAAWQKARRDRRVLERLRDRAETRYRVDARREELRLMDGLAQQAHQREMTQW